MLLLLSHHRKEENQIRNYFQFVRDLFLCLSQPELNHCSTPVPVPDSVLILILVPLSQPEFNSV